MNKPNTTPVGKVIDGLHIVGIERDGENHWVGADLEVNVQGIGSYFLRIVTKEQFLSEKIKNTFEEIKSASPEWFEETAPEERPPYVLNDFEINENVLNTKFMNRKVEQDLAESLWPLIDD